MKKSKPIKKKKGVSVKKEIKQKVEIDFYLFFLPLIIVLPVFHLKFVQDISLVPKLLFLSSALLIYSVFFLMKNRKLNFYLASIAKITFVFWSLYFFFTFISIFQAINPRESLFDIVKVFTTIVTAFFAYLILSRTKNWPDKITKLAAIAGIIGVSIGVSDYFLKVVPYGKDFLPDFREVIYLVMAYMGHKNQYAISLMLLLPFVIYGVFYLKKFWRAVSIVSALSIFSMIVFLQTRSVWTGILLAFLFMVFIAIVFTRKAGFSKVTKIVLISSFAIVTIAGVSFFAFGSKYPKNYTLYKLRSIADPDASNNYYRLKIWDLTGEMIKDKALMGYGAGNWKIVAPNYFKETGFKKHQLNWMRPHNDFLWVFSEKGVFGFLSYLGIFVIIFIAFFKILFKSKERKYKHLALLIAGGVISYLTVSMFTFPLERVNHQVFIALLAAGLLALIPKKQDVEATSGYSFKYLVFSISPILILSILYSVSSIKFEKNIREVNAHLEKKRFNRVLASSESAKSPVRNVDADGTPYDWYLGAYYSQINNYEKAIEHYEIAYKQFPTRISTLNNIGRLYYLTGNSEKAIEYLNKALDIFPEYTETLINISTCYYGMNEYEKCLKALETIRPIDKNETVINNLKAIKRKMRQIEKANKKKDNKSKNDKKKNRKKRQEEKKKL